MGVDVRGEKGHRGASAAVALFPPYVHPHKKVGIARRDSLTKCFT